MIVLSSSPISSRNVEHPADVVVGVLTKPAKTSIMRAYSRFSSALSVSHAGHVGIVRATARCRAGRCPCSIWRWRTTSSRYLSQPMSNLPLYLSIHSLGTWCGAWPAPVA